MLNNLFYDIQPLKRDNNAVRYHGKGYRQLYYPTHPQCDHDGFVMEHRLIYEKYYNCNLLPWANLHHKNSIPTDNRIENLEAFTIRQHTKLHRTGIARSEQTKQRCREHHNPNSNLVGRGPYKRA
jgi:hypothetical protein